jgi:cohesin complex subunit SA-1/2
LDDESQMIEQGLHLLGLHIIWKARNLPDAKDTSPDSQSFRATLREQRDSLLEKLVEYVVGQQSNTAEGVKRTVSVSFVLVLPLLMDYFQMERPSRTS